MRVFTKTTTVRCALEHYTAFLLAGAQGAGCVRLSEVIRYPLFRSLRAFVELHRWRGETKNWHGLKRTSPMPS